MSDFQRMAAWTRALTQWCKSQPDLVTFTGQSAVHRAQIMRAEGAFPQALDELALALDRYHLGGFGSAEGLALYERGGGAPARWVTMPVPSLPTSRPAPWATSRGPAWPSCGCRRGRTAAAVSTAQRLLWETVGDVPRSRVLPAAVEILLSAQERESAWAAAEELPPSRRGSAAGR